MVRYLEDLQWQRYLEQFDPLEQRILAALSDERYLWRTAERISDMAQVNYEVVVEKLKKLVSEGWARASLSLPSEDIVFGLAERVDDKPQRHKLKRRSA